MTRPPSETDANIPNVGDQAIPEYPSAAGDVLETQFIPSGLVNKIPAPAVTTNTPSSGDHPIAIVAAEALVVAVQFIPFEEYIIWAVDVPVATATNIPNSGDQITLSQAFVFATASE